MKQRASLPCLAWIALVMGHGLCPEVSGDLGKFNCLDVLMRFGYVNWVDAWVIASPVCCLVACLVLVLVEQSLLVEQPKNPWLHAMIA